MSCPLLFSANKANSSLLKLRSLAISVVLAICCFQLAGCAKASFHQKRLLSCGDGTVDPGEECDNNLTGCTNCVIDYGYTCPGNVCSTSCGDGKVAGAEVCDDGDKVSGNGCSLTCQIETYYNCESTPNIKSVCTPICGDRVIITPDEQCDDGNALDNDGCSSTCKNQTQSGKFTCNAGAPTVCYDTCGDGYNVYKDMNGVSVAGEEDYCDDKNSVNGDGCDNTCTVEQNFECIGGNIVRGDSCRDKCGDGIRISYKNQAGKFTIECDDGNLANGDGCDSNCNVEKDWFCTDGTMTNPDRCWYTLHYRPSIKSVNLRSNGFIGLQINDTVITHSDDFLSNEVSLTLTDITQSGSSIPFSSRVRFGSSNIIIVEIDADEVLLGGKRSQLSIDFHNKVMYSELLKLIENNYSIELTEDPTRYNVGVGLGIAFHVLFGLSFVALSLMILADVENLCVLVIIGTTMQRFFMLLLVNSRPSELLASFWTHFGVVSFKTDYFEYLFGLMVDDGDIAMNGHRYKALGWFGFDTTNIVSNSAGSLSVILVILFLAGSFSFVVGVLKLICPKGKCIDRLVLLLNFTPQILIVVQQLVMNDLTLSVFINMSKLTFNNKTEIFSSCVCLICAVGIFSLVLIPLGLISNNHFKVLMSEPVLNRAGVYYQSVLKKPTKDATFNFLSYYSAFSMVYGLLFSVILISFWSVPLAQLALVAVLNGVYLALACFRPYNQRFLNVINIANHVMVLVSSLLLLTTLGASSYVDYPVYASVACGFVLVLVVASNGFTFGVLFLRLTMPFIRGVKKGFKFEPIIKFSSEDVEVEVPEIVLPNQMHAGRIQYDEPRNRDVKELDATEVSVARSNNVIIEETKEERKQIKTDLQRNYLYNDEAL